jgi:hypothetical protein
MPPKKQPLRIIPIPPKKSPLPIPPRKTPLGRDQITHVLPFSPKKNPLWKIKENFLTPHPLFLKLHFQLIILPI